ncbi:hypothetical protein [Methylobacterium sp. CM6257]
MFGHNEDPAMAGALEILPEEVEELAKLARDMIDKRLAEIPESTRPQFWTIIANVYGRGLTRDAVSATLLEALPELADSVDLSVQAKTQANGGMSQNLDGAPSSNGR